MTELRIPTRDRPTCGSLFSGIGGLDLGLERAGFRVSWQVEIDPFRRQVLEKHWPGIRRHDDVKTFLADDGQGNWREAAQVLTGRDTVAGCRVDLICGGFPCQPVSCAGRRRGDADDRWLWPEMRRVCALVRPRWVLVENVRGLLSAAHGRLFGTVVRDLADLGYLVEWSCISAAAVGALHIRDRVWILGHADRGDETPIASVLGRPSANAAGTGDLADAGARRFSESHQPWHADGCNLVVADADPQQSPGWACLGPDAQQELAAFAGGCRERYWRADPADDPESGVGRVAHGVANRVERIAGLGDSVVPQVAEFIGRRLLAGARP